MTRLTATLARLGRRPSRPTPHPPHPGRAAYGTSPLIGTLAAPIRGVSTSGEPVEIEVPDGLVIFMTSGCLACRQVWAALSVGSSAVLPKGMTVTVVTPDPTLEDRRQVQHLAPSDVAVVMGTPSWNAYRAGPSPWVTVVSAGRIIAEGPAGGWAEVVSAAWRGADRRHQS